MAVKAYDKKELPQVISTLGKAFEFAEKCLPEGAAGFYRRFANSSVAATCTGPDAHPEIGGSAIELVLDVNEDASIDTLLMNEKRLSKQETGRLRWEAELLCRYQWETGLPFPAVFRTLSPERLRALQADHAELSPEELMQKISVSAMQEESATSLARMRRARGLSQTGLAQTSGVSLRSIQQYEQRKKDISHAQARSVLSLAKALGCTMEELLEAEEA